MTIIRVPNNKLTIVLVLIAITVAFFALTSPQKLPIIGLMVPFLLVFISVYALVRFLAQAARVSRATLLALVTAAFSVLLLLLGSLHQLGFRDILLSLAIVALLSWYISRRQQQ